MRVIIYNTVGFLGLVIIILLFKSTIIYCQLEEAYNKNYKQILDKSLQDSLLIYYKSQLEIHKNNNNYQDAIITAFFLGNLYAQSNSDYRNGIKYYKECLQIINNEKLKWNPNELCVLNLTIASFYFQLGQYEEVKYYCNEGLKIQSVVKNSAYYLLAVIYDIQNEADSALYYINKTIELGIFPENKVTMLLSKLEYGMERNDAGMIKETIVQMKSLGISEENVNELNVGSYYTLAVLKYFQNDLEYEKYFNLADSISLSNYDYLDLYNSLKFRSAIYLYAEKYDKAFIFLDSSFKCLNQYFLMLSDPVASIALVDLASREDLRRMLYAGILNFMNTTDDDYLRRVITATEIVAGRSTLKLLVDKNFNVVESSTSTNQIANCQKKISDLNNIISNEKDENRIEKLVSERKNTYKEYEALLNQYYTAIKKSNLGEFESVSFSNIQANLNGEDVVIRYYLYPVKSYAIAFSKEEIWYFDLPSIKQIELSVKAIRNYYKSYSSNNISAESFTLKKYSYQLYKDLLELMADKIENKNLIIIPDQILYYLPFEMLVCDTTNFSSIMNFKDIRFLLNDHSILYTPSLSLLYYLDKKELVNTNSVLLIGKSAFNEIQGRDELTTSREMLSQIKDLQDLPGVENELKSIAENIGKNCSVKILLNENANEQQLKKEIGSKEFKYIHIATHGFTDDSSPQFSSLVFSNTTSSNSEDGLLQSFEIASLNINTDLTVLSACNTGLGKLYSGEGMIGLNQSFFIAGSKSLCLTLWSISDASTGFFMDYFYTNLSAGMTKREALREAKLSLMNNEKYASPYYWAPYILSGATN